MQTQKPGKRPRPLLKKTVRFVAVWMAIGLVASGVYGSYLFADYMQREKKSAELPGLYLYPEQESRATNAYSWYASYPKLNEPVFDRSVSKLVNDAKAAFLARVNFQATTKYPMDDLNISFEIGGYDSRSLSMTIVKKQTLKNIDTANRTTIAYDRLAKRIVSMKDETASRSSKQDGVEEKMRPSSPDATCKKARCIALTFNDGPSPVTPRILDTLKTYKAKATFFEIGAQAKLYPSIARRTAAEGHAIGTLGHDHRNLLAIPEDEAAADMHEGSNEIRTASGVHPSLARAPYGAMTGQLAQKMSLPFIGWNVADQNESGSSQDIYKNVMANVHAGAVVVSRDTQMATADAYTRIVPELMKQGYTLVTVPQLLGANTPGLYGGN